MLSSIIVRAITTMSLDSEEPPPPPLRYFSCDDDHNANKVYNNHSSEL